MSVYWKWPLVNFTHCFHLKWTLLKHILIKTYTKLFVVLSILSQCMSHYRPLPAFHTFFPLQGVDTEVGWWSGTNRSIFPTLLGGDYAWLSIVGLSNKWNALCALSFDGPSHHIPITYLSHKSIPLIEARLACNIFAYKSVNHYL